MEETAGKGSGAAPHPRRKHGFHEHGLLHGQSPLSAAQITGLAKPGSVSVHHEKFDVNLEVLMQDAPWDLLFGVSQLP